MNDRDRAVSEHDLHAYADGQLDAADRSRVEAWLGANPADAERVRSWQEQNTELRGMFNKHAKTLPGDSELILSARPPRTALLIKRAIAVAATVLIFASGFALGRSEPVRDRIEARALAEMLPSQAKSAYLIYASDVRHPVEVGADQHAHLVAWLGKRLGTPLKTPDLSKVGFELIGGRLVPVSGNPGALFMYENASGRRVSVLIGRNDENRTTSFRIASDGDLETFYWIDGPLGYAVTGEISRNELQAIANECYRQFES
ncbi:MAG: anti-sigma factor family protein [Hoeflea sp.]|uniref:anti-sigma factor family protein n=1 Tax=Hoeflea sp. TaxID=1940281 RepID=UPI003EF92591